jgi:hypothetical protein
VNNKLPSMRRKSLLIVVAPLLWMAGCSKGPYTAEVTGIVTLDKKPVPTGQVMFHPTAGGPMAYGAIGAEGHYEIRTAGSEGLIPGEYTVTIVSLTKEPWEGITAEQVEQIRRVPRRYSDPATSNQKFKIASGANQCDLPLSR